MEITCLIGDYLYCVLLDPITEFDMFFSTILKSVWMMELKSPKKWSPQ
jgi:hypothetical protein